MVGIPTCIPETWRYRSAHTSKKQMDLHSGHQARAKPHLRFRVNDRTITQVDNEQNSLSKGRKGKNIIVAKHGEPPQFSKRQIT